MENTLKEMLMSLRSSLQSDMISLMHKFGPTVIVLEDRVSQIETNMGDIATTVNELIDAHDDQVVENRWIKDKLVEIEEGLAAISSNSAVSQRACNHWTCPLMSAA